MRSGFDGYGLDRQSDSGGTPPEFFEQEALNLAKKEKRFVRIHSDGTLSCNEIWVDTQTGVNYFYHSAGYGGGLTVLLDRDGKPVISPLPVQDAD